MPAAIPAIVAVVAATATTAALSAPLIAAGFVTAAGALSLGGALIAGAIGSVVAMGASMLVSSAMGLNRRPRTPTPAAQDRKQMLRQPVAPRQIIYGRARVGGTLVYAASSGDDRRFLHLVVVLAGHPCDAVETVFVGDVAIPMADRDASGVVTTGPLAGLCRIRAYLGAQTAADPDLVADSPDGWAATDIGFGVTYLYLRLTYDREKFATGLQNISAVVRGKNDIADPRTGAIGYSTNWAACVLDYLQSPLGVRASAAEIHMPSFVAAANLSDEAVPIAAGGSQTQPRYTCDIVLSRDADRRQILATMLDAGAGTLTYVQGQYRLHGGAFTAATASIGVSDLAGDVQLTLRAPRREAFNAVKGTFIDPSKNWQEAPFPAVTIPAIEAEDGERVWRDIQLPAVIDATRAQRLARIELLRGREQERVEVPLRYAGIRFGIWQMLSVTLPDLGWFAKPMRVEGWRFSPDGGSVVVRLREESAASFAWTHEAAAAVPTAPSTTLISPLDIPAPTALAVAPSTSLQGDGGVVPALVVTWTAAAHAFVTSHEVQWRLAAGPGPWSSAEVPAGTNRHVIAPVRVGDQLDVRVRAIAALARSAFAGTVQQAAAADTTVPGIPAGVAAVGVIRGYSIAWTLPADLDLLAVEVWEATSNNPAARIFAGETRATGFVRTGLAPGAMRWVWVRSRDRSGNLSAFAAPVQVTASLALAGDIADGVLGTAKFAAGIEPVGLVASLPATQGGNPRTVLNTADNKLYRWNGAAYTAVVPAADITGTLSDAQIASLAAAKLTGQITGTQITDNAVTAPKIAASAVTADKVAASAIIAGKIAANAVATAQIQAGAVDAARIAAGAVTADKVAANAIVAGKVAAGAISTAELAAGAVRAQNLASETLITQAGQLGTAVVGTAQIGDLAVNTLKLQGESVSTFVSHVRLDAIEGNNTFQTVMIWGVSCPSVRNGLVLVQWDVGYNSNNIEWSGRLIANGINVRQINVTGAPNRTPIAVMHAVVELGAGANTLELQWSGGPGQFCGTRTAAVLLRAR